LSTFGENTMSLINRIITKKLRALVPPRYEKLVTLDKLFNGTEFPEIILLGDSVMERITHEDADARDLGKMVTDLFRDAGRSCIPISGSAYHMLVYDGFIRAMQTRSCFPLVIVLPVNIRSFSPQWDLQPYWQFNDEIKVLNKYCETHGKEIGRLRRKKHENISLREKRIFRDTAVNYPLSLMNRIGQFVDVIESRPQEKAEILKRKREILIFHYSYPLIPQHRKVIALDQILNTLYEHRIKLLIYLTPINFRAGERLVGPGFGSQLAENVEVLSNLIASHARPGLKFADWSCSFDSSYFFSEDLATEHINQNGRLELARMITNEVITLLETKD